MKNCGTPLIVKPKQWNAIVSHLTTYGNLGCTDFLRTREQLDGFGVDFNFIDILHDEDAALRAEEISSTKRSRVVVFPDQSWGVETSNEDFETLLAQKNLIQSKSFRIFVNAESVMFF